MKDATVAYIAKEEASTRKPVELYRIWWGETYQYYTNGDVPVTFDNGDGTGEHKYNPATISRGTIQYDSTLDINTLKVLFSAVTEPTIQYIAQNPVAIVWIEVARLFRDQTPYEASIIFIGQIKSAAFKGISVEAECVGFEHFLLMPIPVLRYQKTCNHQLFDEGCGLDKDESAYPVDAVVTLNSTKTVLTSDAFLGYDAGYFISGLVEFGEERRTVVAQSGSTVTLQYQFQGLEDGDTVTAYPGCDGEVTTCRDKFNNILNFLGFPFIPDENPATRMP